MSISTVWSVEVGKSSLKAVKIHRDQTSLEIVAVDKVDFQAGDTGIDSVGQAKDALRVFASRNNIDCPVAVVHPSRSAFSRFIQLPPVDPRKLEEMIGYEAQQQIPFPIDEVIWDYHISEGNDGSLEKEVGIFAVRREAISDFVLDYREFPLELISVGYIGLLNYVAFDLRPNRPVVVLDVGADETDLLVVDGNRFWFRSLAGAGKDFTQALQEKFKLNFHQAEELKIDGAKSEHAAKIFQVIQPHLRDLVNEINRSIGFYKSQAGEVKFEDLFLFGNGSKLLGLKNFLQEHLKFRVHVAKAFHRLRVNRESNVGLLQKDFPSFASCVGAGIQALGDGVCEVNLLPQEQQEALEFKKKQKTVLIAAASLYVLIAWLFFSYDRKIRDANAALDTTRVVANLDQAKKTIDELEGDRRAALQKERTALLGPVEDRLEPYAAWAMVQQIFTAIGNQEIVTPPEFTKETIDSGKASLEGDQERLNANKWWIALFEVQRVWRDEQGRVVEKPDKNQTVTPAYRVQVSGVRYRIGTEQENTIAVQERIRQRVEEELRARYGELSASDVVTVKIHNEPPTRIYIEHRDLKEKKKGSDDLIVLSQDETFFGFDVSWTIPLWSPPALANK